MLVLRGAFCPNISPGQGLITLEFAFSTWC